MKYDRESDLKILTKNSKQEKASLAKKLAALHTWYRLTRFTFLS